MNEVSASVSPPAQSPSLSRSPGQLRKERGITLVLGACAGLSVLVMGGIVLVLLVETVRFFSEVSVLEFVSATQWTPLFREKHFGILPLLVGSILVTLGAALLAIPSGVLAAVYLSEYAHARVRTPLRAVLGVLAGIPTVVYGYLALTFITPLLRVVFPGAGIFNAASASFALGIMILPTVALLSADALEAVPASLKEAAAALGASPADVTARVVIPTGMPGILASFVLAASRAFGETMVVAIAAGSSATLTLNPLDSIQAMTAYILQAGQGNIMGGTLEYRTLFAVGMMLFLMTVGLNSASRLILARFRVEGS